MRTEEEGIPSVRFCTTADMCPGTQERNPREVSGVSRQITDRGGHANHAGALGTHEVSQHAQVT